MNESCTSHGFRKEFLIRGAWLAAMLLFSFPVRCAAPDSLVMRVGGRSVGLTEFVSAYRRHAAAPDESAEQFARRYADFLLTVQAAEEEGMDTLPAVRHELDMLHRQLRNALFPPSPADEAAARALYARMRRRYGTGQVRVAELVRPLPQRIASGELRREEELMDSLARVIGAGASFDECVSRYSAIRKPRRVGALQMPEEWETAVSALAPGETSRLFRTAQGLHIVKLLEREEVPPYEAVREELLERVARRRDTGGNRRGNPEGKRNEREDTARQAARQAMKSRLRMRRDSCLARLCLRELSKRTASDEAALRRLYEQDPEKYRRPALRFRGIVLRCADKRTGKQLKRLLKSLPENEWGNAVRLTVRRDSSLRVEYAQGVFAPGDHPDVDEKIFKLRSPKRHPRPDLPCIVCLGRKRKASADWQETREELAEELYRIRLHRLTEERRRLTEVEINQEVLKTVNKH